MNADITATIVGHMKDELTGEVRTKYPNVKSILVASGIDRDEYGHGPRLTAVRLADGTFAHLDLEVETHETVLGVPYDDLPEDEDAVWVDGSGVIFDGMPESFFCDLQWAGLAGVTLLPTSAAAYLGYEINIEQFLTN